MIIGSEGSHVIVRKPNPYRHYQYTMEEIKSQLSSQEKEKLHSVLSYQNEEDGVKESGCINRDLNSVLNMEKIVKHLIETGERISLYKPNQ